MLDVSAFQQNDCYDGHKIIDEECGGLTEDCFKLLTHACKKDRKIHVILKLFKGRALEKLKCFLHLSSVTLKWFILQFPNDGMCQLHFV